MTISLDGALAIARQAAELAAVEIMRYYRGDFQVEIKPDQTPVTVADRKAEEIIHSTLLTAFPDHGFYGEETGRSRDDSDYLWLVDPIDGTKSFIRHYPFFSTQIALMHAGRMVVGVSSAPAFEELAWAALGEGAWLDGERIQVSNVDALSRATVSTPGATPGRFFSLFNKEAPP